jgi:hypothetical protein
LHRRGREALFRAQARGAHHQGPQGRARRDGKLDFDPFIDAQDWEIDTVDIALREVAPDKTSATVSFKNLGEPHSVVLDLVKLKTGWRIADITWDRKHALGEDTLRGILTKK